VTGFSKHTRELVFLRAHGRCERCGRIELAMQYHHRRPRAMGGSKAGDTNGAANCLLLCTNCHRYIESARNTAIDAGWLVPQGKKPEKAPLWLDRRWVLLDNYGYVMPAEESA
jgi:5-methylcytosine-specific restriction protein A